MTFRTAVPLEGWRAVMSRGGSIWHVRWLQEERSLLALIRESGLGASGGGFAVVGLATDSRQRRVAFEIVMTAMRPRRGDSVSRVSRVASVPQHCVASVLRAAR
jgi:hypothetical protein